MFNSNMWPNSAPLQDIRLRNLSDLDFDLQGRSRSNVMVSLTLHICFPIDINSIYLSVAHLSLYPYCTMVNFNFRKQIVKTLICEKNH